MKLPHNINKIASLLSSNQKLPVDEMLECDSDTRKITIIEKLSHYISRYPQKPLHFVLPGFPFKFPIRSINDADRLITNNHTIVDLSDYAAIRQMADLMRRINDLFPYGARLSIVSDAEGFVRTEQADRKNVAQYKTELEIIIDRIAGGTIKLKTFHDLYPDRHFEDVQSSLHVDGEHYREHMLRRNDKVFMKALPAMVEYQKENIKTVLRTPSNNLSPTLLIYKNSITSGVNKHAKKLAYEHLFHQYTWRYIIDFYFVESIRLTIHPASIYSHKIGLYLTPSCYPFSPAPWQGVPIVTRFHNTDIYMHVNKDLARKLDLSLTKKYYDEIDMELNYYEMPADKFLAYTNFLASCIENRMRRFTQNMSKIDIYEKLFSNYATLLDLSSHEEQIFRMITACEVNSQPV